MSTLINTEIKPFAATAFHNGSFVPVTDADLRGKWSIVFFYPADFTFVCPTELGDLADHYADLQAMGVEVYSVSTTAWASTTSPTRSASSIRRLSRSAAARQSGSSA